MLLLNRKRAPISFFKETITLFVLVFFGTIFLVKQYWLSQLVFLHTLIEVVCIFISLASFLVVWYTYERNNQVNQLISFCFLAVAIFDIVHSLAFWGYMVNVAERLQELAVWFWLLGRIFVGFIFVLIPQKTFYIPKWVGFWGTMAFAVTVSWLLYSLLPFLPPLFDSRGSLVIKYILEGTIIGLFLYALFNIKTKLVKKGIVPYYYIFAAVIVAILTEFCFTFYMINTAFSGLAHLLKVTYYFLFLKGIFVSLVIYPYEKYEENNEVLKSVLNGLPIGVIMYDENIKICFANTRALELLHCQLRDIYSCSPREMERKFGHINKIPQMLLRGDALERDSLVELTLSSGQKLKFKTDYYQLANRFLVMFEDAKKEQDLIDLKLQTKTVLNSINNAIIITNVDYKIMICNTKTIDLLEMKETDLLGQNIYSLFDGLRLDPPNGESNFQYIKSVKLVNGQRLSIVTGQGNKRELLLHIDQIKNIDDEIIGMILTAADITMINEENERLRQNEKMVLLGQMVAGIVHEIKNPLTAIKGFSQLIGFRSQDEKVLEYTQYIEKETEIINLFISDFLQFAKPSLPELRETTVAKVIDSIKALVDTNAFIRKTTVLFEIKDGEKTVIVDINKIRQVLLNITQNAIEVLEGQNKPTLIISTGYFAKTSEIGISIYNNGKPMTEEERMKVGTPFFTTKASGTGLGLSICYQIILEHHGRIEIESGRSEGTKFIIYLPCSKANGHKKKTEV